MVKLPGRRQVLAEFKKGDRVRIITPPDDPFTGVTGTVSQVIKPHQSGGADYQVLLDEVVEAYEEAFDRAHFMDWEMEAEDE